MLADPLRVALRVIKVLEANKIRYLIGGSLASSLYGFPRATQDIDIVAEIHHDHLQKLASELEHDFFVDEPAIRDALRRGSSFNLIDREELFKVDIFPAKLENKAEMERRVLYPLAGAGNTSAYLCSAEDVIAHKLYWYTLGGNVSDRQWTDLVNVLKVQKGKLDLKYLREACALYETTDLLDKAIGEAQ